MLNALYLKYKLKNQFFIWTLGSTGKLKSFNKENVKMGTECAFQSDNQY